MVSHQLGYVTGMLEVILTPSDPSGGCGRLRSFPGTRHAWPASLTAPSDSSGRLRPPAKFSWYPAILASVPDGPFRGRELSLVPGKLGRHP